MNNHPQVSTENQKASFSDAFFISNQTYIHPTATVGAEVELGSGVKVGPYCVITGKAVIGDNTRLHAHVVIGFPAQVLGMKEPLGVIEIGSNCDLREFVSVHASRYPTGKTKIGNTCYLMSYSHVSHDSILEDNVTLINNVQLGGHTHVEKNAFLMANSATHQFCRIGQFAALAPFSATRQDLPPFCLFDGQPGSFAGLNVIALKRTGFTVDTINGLKHITKLFYQDKLPLAAIQEQAEQSHLYEDEKIRYFLDFIQSSSRGVSRRTIAQSNNDETNIF